MADPDKLIHSLVSFLALDGTVGPAERRFLQETSQRLGLPAASLDHAFALIKEGKGKLHLPSDPAEMRELFYLLVQSAVADGRIDPKERQILGQVAERAGISAMDLDNAIAVRLELATTAARELAQGGTAPERRERCPKCGFEQPGGGGECLRCGIVFAKWQQQHEEAERSAEGLDALGPLTGLAIVQRKDWMETITSLDVSNAYAVSGPDGRPLFRATEQEGGLLRRLFLQALRPFEIEVRGADSRRFLVRVSRPFRFYFHEATIYGDRQRPLGRIRKQFAWLRRIYRVEDPQGRLLFQLFGPLLHPWTFEVRRGGQVVGKITKKWSGLVTEALTVADNFGVTFPADLPAPEKAILLGAVFLIDFVHFETKDNR